MFDVNIFQIAGIAFIGAIMTIIFNKNHPEYVVQISIATGILIVIQVVPILYNVLHVINSYAMNSGIGKEYIEILLKITAIAYITEFISAICRDAGQNAISSKVELGGRIIITGVSLPIFISVINIIEEILIF